jgi:hypothetical protein
MVNRCGNYGLKTISEEVDGRYPGFEPGWIVRVCATDWTN